VYPGNDAIALYIAYGSMDIVNSDMENVAVWFYLFLSTLTLTLARTLT
jgi:hypothetical protein